MISTSSWMFISSFEKLRHHVIDDATILTMTQLSTHGFPNVTVPTCMWVMCGERLQTKGTYIRLEDFDRPQWQQPRTLEAVSDPGCPWRYEADAESFKAIPGWPIAYWATRNVINAFNNGKPINQYMDCHSGISVKWLSTSGIVRLPELQTA